METVIRCQDIEKQFDGEQVIYPLNLEIYEGEFLTLLGPSGCGKTTLLRMIAGFEQPDAGEIYLNEQPQASKKPYERNMNMVFQQYALFPHMTVEQNILFGLRLKKIPLAEQQERLAEVLEDTQLEKLRHRKPAQLSGGQQQRVAIARAIINEPQVLLLDEPLGALDYQLRKSLQIELKKLQQTYGITFVYVTHDQEEALTMSDRIVVLNHGKVEQLGTPREIYRKPQTVFVANFIGENNVFRQADKVFSVRPEAIKMERATDAKMTNAKKKGRVEHSVFTGSVKKVYVQAYDSSGVVEETQALIKVYEYINLGQSSLQVGEEVILSWTGEDEVSLR